jgi:hypothetical protein
MTWEFALSALSAALEHEFCAPARRLKGNWAKFGLERLSAVPNSAPQDLQTRGRTETFAVRTKVQIREGVHSISLPSRAA